MNVAPVRPHKRPNVRFFSSAWFAPEAVLAEVQRRWASWPIRLDLDLDLREEDVLAELRSGRT